MKTEEEKMREPESNPELEEAKANELYVSNSQIDDFMYCKYCGARLKKDHIGKYCPTKNCQWSL
ncbi:MAG: hypothetical protein ACFFG0_10435 [Candidatus Thorarchaeota archaeon]